MVENNLFVLDSSILIKWFAEEPDSHEAKKIQDEYVQRKIRVILPSLYVWELNNYLSRNFDLKTAMSIFYLLKGFKFDEVMVTPQIAGIAFNLCNQCPGVSFYDASYHALAIDKEAVFITSDRKYYEKVKKFGAIKLLSDI